MKKLAILLILICAFSLCGCRVRTTLLEPEHTAEEPLPAPESAAPVHISIPAELPPEPSEAPEEPEPPREPEPPDEAANEPETEDDGAERRVFDADAGGELDAEAEAPLHAVAEEPSEEPLPTLDGESGETVNVESDEAERRVVETVAAGEAEQLGVAEDGAVAESVLTYYLTLLDERVGNLFECKRLNVYWETQEDHRTVLKDSPAHEIVTLAGAYDVSAKLLEENLTVDDGWVCRKNPDAVVKLLDGPLDPAAAGTLCGELAARPGWEGLGAVRNGRVLVLSRELSDTQAGRTAAAVYLAKLLYPEQLADIDADEALRALFEEAGELREGLYAYIM